MAELTYTLGEHPQIIELLSVLEKNNLQRQKEEVQALVGYIDGMEDKLAQMMEEMKEIRLEVGKLHDKGIRAKCAQLVTAAEGKIQQVKAMVSTAKANLMEDYLEAVLVLQQQKGYSQIYEKVWGEALTVNERGTVGYHVRNLRRKLYSADPHHPFIIESIREIGYRFQTTS